MRGLPFIARDTVTFFTDTEASRLALNLRVRKYKQKRTFESAAMVNGFPDRSKKFVKAAGNSLKNDDIPDSEFEV